METKHVHSFKNESWRRDAPKITQAIRRNGMTKLDQEVGSQEWDSLHSVIFRVVNEDGENMAGALIRKRADNSTWLYVDEMDGYRTLNILERNRLIVERAK